MRLFVVILSAVLFSMLVFAGHAAASQTDGTIDATQKYAWGEKTGWLNFGTTGGNIHVTDATLTGYVWSENFGWINLAPSQSGVTNDGNGNLSGSAWAQNLGYINFSGVTISSAGLFAGQASGTVSGRINFSCTNCAVVTDWRPQSARSSGSSGSGATVGVGAGSAGTGPPPSNAGTSSGLGSSTSGTFTNRFPGTTFAKTADFNHDGRVNIIDLSILLFHYHERGPAAYLYDLNNDNEINFPDISIVMFYWTRTK